MTTNTASENVPETNALAYPALSREPVTKKKNMRLSPVASADILP
jgi:hypothetical protein